VANLAQRERIDPTAPALAPIPSSLQRNGRVILRLLGAFELVDAGEPVPLPASAQRLVAFLALARSPVQRSKLAWTLWPDKSEDRAMANLRSALWRVRQPGIPLIEHTGTRLALHPSVTVDLDGIVSTEHEATLDDLVAGTELLPDWYDDWVLVERERIRQLHLHALEAACSRLLEKGRAAEAVDVGLRLVAVEPLRESGHRALIEAHLHEGNLSEAIRQFDAYVSIARAELGVDPTPALIELAPVFAVRIRTITGPIRAEH
jgi:DNA-binding SARP family transcriptional activator